MLAALHRRIDPDAPLLRAADLDRLPTFPGAYALCLRLEAPLRIDLPGAAGVLPAGRHVYAGSAYGPGGVRARLKRHFRPDKRPHWHVDRLTAAAVDLAAVALEGGRECAIVAALQRSTGARHAIPGFGASDCRTCRSHLLTVDA